jgi:hypothetical protein
MPDGPVQPKQRKGLSELFGYPKCTFVEDQTMPASSPLVTEEQRLHLSEQQTAWKSLPWRERIWRS